MTLISINLLLLLGCSSKIYSVIHVPDIIPFVQKYFPDSYHDIPLYIFLYSVKKYRTKESSRETIPSDLYNLPFLVLPLHFLFRLSVRFPKMYRLSSQFPSVSSALLLVWFLSAVSSQSLLWFLSAVSSQSLLWPPSAVPFQSRLCQVFIGTFFFLYDIIC